MSSTEAGRNEAIAGLTSSSADSSQEAAELLITPRFDATDWGWVIISIGMAIGAGIVFLPVQVGLVGIWVFLLSAIVGYPAMYLFQRLFINSLAASEVCTDSLKINFTIARHQDRDRFAINHEHHIFECVRTSDRFAKMIVVELDQ